MKVEIIKKMAYNICNLDIIRDLLRKFNILSYEEIQNLMDKLEECDFNYNALDLVRDKNVLNKFSLKEILKLINKLKENEFNINEIRLVTDSDILNNFDLEEIFKLINKLRKCKFNDKALNVIQNITF